jgi:VanZ family protein
LIIPVLDEYVQLFSPGRTSRVSDVLVDFMGGLIGLGLSLFLMKSKLRKNIKNESA